MKHLFRCCLAFLTMAHLSHAQTIYLDELNLSTMESGWGTPSAGRSVDGHPLTVGGKTYERGVGTHA